MEVYRLARQKYAHILSGRGAALYGARWNSKGTELIYTAENRSLAMAEVAVHMTLATLPPDYMMITIEIPDDIAVSVVAAHTLPAGWRDFPHPVATQRFGDEFVSENKYCVLRIPSVVTQGDFNLLINPAHRDFARIRIASIDKFPFDRRILK